MILVYVQVFTNIMYYLCRKEPNMVIKTVNDLCLESQFKETQDPTEDEDAQLQHPTREERMLKYRSQCKNLVEYLSTNVCPQGLSKNEIRNIKNQAKTHQWDSRSKKSFNSFHLFSAKLNQTFKYLNSQQMAVVVISLLIEM